METPKQLFDTRVNVFLGDAASPSPTTFATKPEDGLDRRLGGTRDGRRDATGGACPDPDSLSRCHGAMWEISYIPYTCVTCRLHVRLHAMEVVTRQLAGSEAGFRDGGHLDHGLLRLHGADARGWLTAAHPRGREKAQVARGLGAGKTVPDIAGADESCGIAARTLAGRGRVSALRMPARRAEPGLSRARPTGSSDAANASSQPTRCHTTGLARGWLPPPLRTPRASRSRGGRAWGRRPLPPVSVRRDA